MNVRNSQPALTTAADALHLSERSRAVAIAMAPLLLLYLFYTFVRWTVVERGAATGDRNASRVIDFERRIGVDWELALQSNVLPHNGLVWLANHYYVYAFLPVLIGSALLSAFRAPAIFNFWRNVFAMSLGAALVVFSLFPLTPPRLLGGEAGFVDTLMIHGPRYYGDESGASLFNAYGSIPSMVNEYAAMPSMHVGWSLIAGALLIAAFPTRKWLIPLVVAHVLFMQLAVVATGNHYVIDGLVGVAVIGLSYLAILKISRTAMPTTDQPATATMNTGD